jgi:acyl carrier protein
MSASTEEMLESLRAWLLARKPEITDIDLDLDLIENRVVDSLSFIEFLYFLEELTGNNLQTEAESLGSFRSLRVIRDNIIGRIANVG